MQSQEMRSTYNLRSNEFHSLAVGFSFSENNIFSSLVMRYSLIGVTHFFCIGGKNVKSELT